MRIFQDVYNHQKQIEPLPQKFSADTLEDVQTIKTYFTKQSSSISNCNKFEEDIIYAALKQQEFGPKFTGKKQPQKSPDDVVDDEVQVDITQVVEEIYEYIQRILSMDLLLQKLNSINIGIKEILIIQFLVPRIQLIQLTKLRDSLLLNTEFEDEQMVRKFCTDDYKTKLINYLEKLILAKYYELKKTVNNIQYLDIAQVLNKFCMDEQYLTRLRDLSSLNQNIIPCLQYGLKIIYEKLSMIKSTQTVFKNCFKQIQ